MSDNALLTLWLGDKSLLLRPSWFAGRRAGRLTPRPFAVRSSCQRVNGRRLLGARWAAAKWPGRMTTFCCDPCASSWPPTPPSFPPSSPFQSETGAQDLASGLYSCCESFYWSPSEMFTTPLRADAHAHVITMLFYIILLLIVCWFCVSYMSLSLFRLPGAKLMNNKSGLYAKMCESWQFLVYWLKRARSPVQGLSSERSPSQRGRLLRWTR